MTGCGLIPAKTDLSERARKVDFTHFFSKSSLRSQNLNYRLKIVFALFFLFPVIGFIYFGYKYDILKDEYIPFYFLGLLAFSFLGFTILRRLFDEISSFSKTIMEGKSIPDSGKNLTAQTSELQNIVSTFSHIEKQFKDTTRQLDRRAAEISVLKELSELCYITFDPKEILYVMLERSLILTHSDIGSVMIREQGDPGSFVVRASIGLGDLIKVGDRVDFETSIAKYAVLNKSPLIIENIETDTRFGRANRTHYGSKSFVCMPIKTSKEILGVLTVSRRSGEEVYSQGDIEILTPLLSNAAFTYENLRLLKENEIGSQRLQAVNNMFKVVNSSIRGSELTHAILNEIQNVIPLICAMILTVDESRSDCMQVSEIFSREPVGVAKGVLHPVAGSIFDRAWKQKIAMTIRDTAILENDAEKELLIQPGGKSAFLSPLKIDGAIKGVVIFLSGEINGFYETGDFLDWASNLVSFTLDRNRLTAAVAKRDLEMGAIRQIGSALAASTFDMNKVLSYTMDMIKEVMDAEAGSLMLLEGDELAFVHAFNVDINVLKPFRLKLGQGIAGYAAATGQTVVENNVKDSPHFFTNIDNSTGFQTRSAICVPLVSHGKVIGVIEVMNKTDGTFTANDVDVLQSISSSVSVAMENARLYKETVAMAENERDIRGVFQKFVPKEIVDQIIHGQGTGVELMEEYKRLTMLNIDIRGFTGLTKKLGPQKTVSLLNSFFSVMGEIVFKHHGIVDKYLGDGFLALFGTPVSTTKDADNAISAALEMKKALSRVDDRFVKSLGSSFDIGISIHTGEVVVGNFGFERKMDYTVIGDSVNTLFRMQELTKTSKHRIVISESTRQAARSDLQLREYKSQDPENYPGSLAGTKIYELTGWR